MKSEVPIEYIQLDYRKANYYQQVLTEIKKIIEEKVREEFVLVDIKQI